MTFFGSIASALIGAKSSKKKTAASSIGGILGGSQTTSDKPIATDHKHSSDSSKEEIKNEAISVRPYPSFMGKGQMDDFASLTDPSSVDRGGNVIAPAPTALPLVGQTPSDISPEDAFKITPRQDIDEIGMNKLYNT
jgi:hypothetical protein